MRGVHGEGVDRGAPGLEPASRAGAEAAPSDYPLTRRQTLFWLDAQLYAGVPYHHIVLRITLTGALDVTRLRAAYRDTLFAFDQYRLVFSAHGGEPRQRFAAELNPELPLFDLSQHPEQLDAWIARRASTPFDFARGLFDAALLRLSNTQHVFYFCQHHIISDGSSVGLFVADLAARYRGEMAPERPPYARYLRSEQTYQRSARADRDAAYFSKRLAAGMPPLSLYGRTRKRRTLGVVRTRVEAGAERSRALAELVKDARFELMDAAISRLVSLSTLLFAFLYRASGSRTLVIATPLPNRGVEFVDTGGLIMEQTFLRVDIDDGESFVTLADKVRSELVGALRHGKHCISDRGLSYATLNLLRLPPPDFDGLGVELELAPVATWFGTRAQPSASAAAPIEGDLRDTFGLHVIGFDEDKPLQVGFDFHADTFDPRLQERARGHFFALFDALLADPARALDAVDLLAPEERAELLQLGRGPEPAAPAPDPLLRFGAVLAARGEHAALRFSGQCVSYDELFASAGRVATRLRSLGARPGARVAFCLSRGPDELLAMLASWIAGAAYVPIDSSHPPDRVQMILEDAAPDVLITQRDLVGRLRAPASARVLLLDAERAALAGEPVLPLPDDPAAIDPEQPAYVLFTSGSTGRPKGVSVPRRAIANFLASMAEAPGLKPEDRLLAITTTTFDIAGLELLLPLWVGASVQIADRETVLDAHKLRETLERDGITVMQATPTGWRMLLEAGFGRERHALKMLCGGEAISRELAGRLLAAGGELWNMYGPTETTVWSTIHRLLPDQQPISIGRPIDATQVYVLGPARALEPQGVTGELFIGGAGVALGYLGRAELTRERFVQNPYGPPGDVIYRTGDLARFLPDGTLECLGRVDHQVKLRGFRIELGEIESCLRAVTGLREVLVVPVGPAEDPRLVAYWVGADDREPALRERAARTLPSFMQPAAYVRLPALPLNTNGKIDRKQLPEPDVSRFGGAQQQFSSDLELRMAGLFQEVLDGLEVPVDKDFFMLGGDSVRAMHLRRRIREEFGSELPLAAMFESPTVRSLVAALDARSLPRGPLFVRLRAGHARVAPLICVMGVAVYRDLALALSTDRAVYGAHVPLALAEGEAAPSVEEIAERYTQLILERVPRGPYHLLGLCFGGLVAFEVAHQLLARGHEVQTLAVLDGLLPRGERYSPLSHARALLGDPRRVLRRARERLRGLTGRGRLAAPASPAEAALDLALQGREAARLARIYDRHARPLPIPFTLFRATEREEAAWYTVDAALGWASLGSSVSVHSVPGSHLGILQRGSVAPIAEVLSAELEGSGTAERASIAPRASLLS